VGGGREGGPMYTHVSKCKNDKIKNKIKTPKIRRKKQTTPK
jgi:hypothetical protein